MRQEIHRFDSALARKAGRARQTGARAEHWGDQWHFGISRMVAACRADPDRDAPLVQALIAARDPQTDRPLTDAEISNDLLIFMLAGHDTTATALTYALWILELYGHANVSLMDGGRVKWLADGRPSTPVVPSHAAKQYRAQEPNPALRAQREEAKTGGQQQAARHQRTDGRTGGGTVGVAHSKAPR